MKYTNLYIKQYLSLTSKNKINLKNNKGFTLIELMITVAIVGILAAVALPAYQDYVARSQVSEGLVLVSGAKPVIAEYYANHGAYPTSSDIGFNGYVGSYIGTTTIGDDGAIIATFSNDAHRQLRGQTVTLTPEEDTNTGNLKWNCGSSVDSKYLPTSCANDGSTGNPTNPEEGGNTEPPFDFWKNTGSYAGELITYNGDGTITFAGQKFTGTLVNGEMIFDLTSMFGPGVVSKIDKDGNFVNKQEYDNGLYSRETTYIKGGNSSSIDTYIYPDIGGQSYTLDSISSVENSGAGPDYYDNNLYFKFKNSADIFITYAKNGTLPPDALANYNNAKNDFINHLKQQKANGVQLNITDEAYIKGK